MRKDVTCPRRASRGRRALPLVAAGAAALLIWPVDAQQQPDAGLQLPPALVRQIEALADEKARRTPAQQKVSSHLLRANRIRLGAPIADGVLLRQSPIEIDTGGMVAVDIRADVTPEVLTRVDALGGAVINSVPRYRAIRARLPLAAVEMLAELEAIQWIRPADEPITRGQAGSIPKASRADVRDAALTRRVNTSEGDIAHRADRARRQFGVDGAGIGIGVLSDGVDTLAQRQASGDLPATVTVLPGQARPPASMVEDDETFDEGTAMLEIVHDLAPGAELYFATAFSGQAQFATNIEALCDAGADVIVDDIGYFRDAVFQDDVVARGVNAAVAKGCVYFSAAGNAGNLNDRTSGVWEGDFRAGQTINLDGRPLGTSHLFGSGANLNAITADQGHPVCLKWSDRIGASSNDYDIYVLDPTRSVVYTDISSTDTQSGTQDPVECIPRIRDDEGRIVGMNRFRLLVVRVSGSGRYLHLNTNRGQLSFSTSGQTYGHSAAANAIGVAATDATRARGAGGVFNGTESVETFSSDGPRRMFFHPDGRPITPGDFSSTGGLLLRKPDVTAADGVVTATPGFERFHGTSAAAPHAAAIAALMLQAAGGPRSLTRAQLLQAMQDTALDIEAPGGWDRDSGAGIIDALAAVEAVQDGANRAPGTTGPVPARTLTVGGGPASVNVAPYFTDPDGDALTYTAASSRTGVVRAAVSGSTVTLTPVSAGTATVTVTARDPGGLSATQSISVAVAPPGAGAFTDDPLVPGVTPVRAVHLRELRVRIDGLRARAGLPAFAWTDRALTPGATPVRRVHVTDLRTALAAAYGAAGQPAPVYTDARVTVGATPIRAVHIAELRTAVIALEAGSGGNCTNDLGAVSGTVTRNGSWDGSCASVHYSNGRHARYYTFRLSRTASVTIDLTSPSVDTWLALRNGAGTGTGLIEADDDGGSGSNARISRTLAAGTYTIEATTFAGGATGPFTLTATVGPGSGEGSALTGRITTCSGTRTVGTIVNVVIAGSVTARRAVSLVTLTGRANGDFVGFELIGDMSAGQTENFRMTGIVSTSASTLRCTVETSYRDSRGSETGETASLSGTGPVR